MRPFPSIKLTYFNAAGRAEASRLAFYIGGVPFEDKRITFQEFGVIKETLPLGQAPTLEVDGEVFTQSYAILRLAGRLSGLYPVNSPYLALRVDEILHVLTELEEKMSPSFREKDPEKKKAMRQELASTILPRYASLVEERLKKLQEIVAFQKNAVFVHDLTIYALVKSFRAGYIDDIPTTVFDSYKLLNETHDKVANLPKVKEWYSFPHSTPKLKLTYFPIPGRAESIRLALFIGGIAFEDERISHEEFEARKPSLPFNQLPVLEVDGQSISQSMAILRYVGTLSGLYPSYDLLGAYRIDEIFAIIEDLFNFPLWRAARVETDTQKQLSMREELSNGMITKTLGFLENRIIKNKGPYATGPTLTVADLAIHDTVAFITSGISGIPTSIASSYSNLQRVFNLVLEHPKVKEWKAAHKK